MKLNQTQLRQIITEVLDVRATENDEFEIPQVKEAMALLKESRIGRDCSEEYLLNAGFSATVAQIATRRLKG